MKRELGMVYYFRMKTSEEGVQKEGGEGKRPLESWCIMKLYSCDSDCTASIPSVKIVYSYIDQIQHNISKFNIRSLRKS